MAQTTNPHPPLQLVFRLGSEIYGVDVMKVREIVGPLEVTSVRQTRTTVKGAINLRGKVLPFVDLRARFGMDAAAPTEKSCLLIGQAKQEGNEVTLALAVDEVIEVASAGASGRKLLDMDEVFG